MIKKVPLPKKYHFLVNKKFISKFFEKKKFFQKEIKIEKINPNSVEMAGVLKIFINYLISLDMEKKTLQAIYRFGGSKSQEFQVLRYLSDYKFKNSHFLIPRPLFYFKKEKVLLYENVPGIPLSDLPVKKTLSLLKNKISLFVNSLVSLQKTNPPAPKYNFKKDEIKAKKFEIEFLKFLPESRDLIKKTILEIFEKKKFYLTKNIPPFFTHNDLTLGNLIWQKDYNPPTTHKNSLGLIDFSESCYQDPLTDLGTFLAQLDYLDFRLGGKVLPRSREISLRGLVKNLQKEYIKKYITSLKKDYYPPTTLPAEGWAPDIKNKLLLNGWGKRLSLYRAWGNLQNAIFVLAAQEKIQNPRGCLWFLKVTDNLLRYEK